MKEKPTLSILQYNVRKSRDVVMATLLRDPKILDFDILAIQEPWRNPFTTTTHHPAKANFHLCYPQQTNGPARVCFFINKRLDHTKWQFKEHSRDLCTWTITTQQQRLVMHNVYNPCQNTEDRQSILPQLQEALNEYDQAEQIALGDFNLHHTIWGGTQARGITQEAEELAEFLEEYGLTNTLLPGTITYEEGPAHTTIDLCLVTMGLVDKIIRSEVERELDHDSDHLPIATVIDLRIQQHAQETKMNWKALNTKTFETTLRERLPDLRRLRTKAALDQYVREMAAAIWEAANRATPKSRPCSKSKQGWTEQCKTVMAETKRLRRQHQLLHSEDTWEAYRLAKHHKARIIRKALKQGHREAIEKAAESPESLWRIAKWARNRENHTPNITPELQHPITGHKATKPEEKAELLKETFFPRPPDANLDDLEDITYTGQIPIPPITVQEVEDTIHNVPSLKAPGPDKIPNLVLKIALPWIKIHLTRIFNHSLALGHCPEHFRESTTVVLRKPGKDNYTVPKAYRPIALLNTIGKVMDAIIAKRLSYLAETYSLLPRTHIGGRKLKSVEHALHIIMETIYEAWNTGKGKVASLLLLDVSGAFDNVSHQRLLHNLRKRKIDEKMVRWIESFLKDRHTNILIDGHKSKRYFISTGIPLPGTCHDYSLLIGSSADYLGSTEALAEHGERGSAVLPCNNGLILPSYRFGSFFGHINNR